MPSRLIVCILLMLLVVGSPDERALFAQGTIDPLNVQLLGSGSGYKIVQFTDGTMQRIDWNAEVMFDLEAVQPVPLSDLYVYAVPNFEGRIRFWGTAVDDFGGGFTLNFSTTINLSLVGGTGTLHYSLSKARVTFVDFLLPSAGIQPPRPYRISFFGLQEADVDSVRAYVDMPNIWYFDDLYHMPGIAVDPIVLGIEGPLSSGAYPMKVRVESGTPSYAHPDTDATKVSELVSVTASFLNQVHAEMAVSVSARVGRPDGTYDAFSLYDDGTHGDLLAYDGVYTGNYTLTAPGNYDVTVSAHGVAGQTFESTAFINLTVEQTRPLHVPTEQSDKTVLYQSYPNPFTSETEITYHLPQNSMVSLRIYSMTGRLVQTLIEARQATGSHTVSWDGRDHHGRQVSSGVYLYKLDVEGRLHTGTMVFIK